MLCWRRAAEGGLNRFGRPEAPGSTTTGAEAMRILELLTKVIGLVGILFFLAIPALGQEPCGLDFPHDSNPTKITDNDICNFHQVDAEVYRGARPGPSAYPKLVQLGIRTIITLEEAKSADRERAALAELNQELGPEERIDLISFPITQAEIGSAGLSDVGVHKLFQLIQQARKPVLIHCYFGKDRTGAVIALYRMVRQEKSFSEAYDEALHYGFSPHDLGLRTTLSRYKNPKKLKSLRQP